MNLSLFNNIGLHEPWAILPEYAQAYYPAVAALLKGENAKSADQDFSEARKLNSSYFLSEEDLDDEDFDPDNNNDLSAAPEGSVAVVRLNGPVVKYSQWCGPRGTVDIANDLKRIDSNPNFIGAVFEIESGGGQVYAIKPLTDVLSKMKKPVVCLGGNYVASAAYAIAIHTKEIVVDHPKAIVGSIGTMMSFQDVQPYFESLGVKFHEVYATASTHKNKRTRDALKGDYKSLIKDMLDPINADFLADVKAQRKGKLADNKLILAGETFFASVSKELGMIDHLGDMAFAVNRVRELSKKKSSGADAQNSSTAQSTNPNMNFTNVAALAGVQNATQAQLDQANADLTTAGITGCTIVNESFITEAAVVTTERDTLTASVADLTAQLTAANAAKTEAEANLATANTKITDLEAKVDAFGKNAGALQQTAIGADTPPEQSDDDVDSFLNSLPHNRTADRMLG